MEIRALNNFHLTPDNSSPINDTNENNNGSSGVVDESTPNSDVPTLTNSQSDVQSNVVKSDQAIAINWQPTLNYEKPTSKSNKSSCNTFSEGVHSMGSEIAIKFHSAFFGKNTHVEDGNYEPKRRNKCPCGRGKVIAYHAHNSQFLSER